MAAGTFSGARRARFDPWLIVAQIVVLQAVFYVSLVCFAVLLNRVLRVPGQRLGAQLFSGSLRGVGGVSAAGATLLAAGGPAALALATLVRRARRCPDFAATVLVSHAAAVALAAGLPREMRWWALHTAAALVMTIVAESVCRAMEERERNAELVRDTAQPLSCRSSVSAMSLSASRDTPQGAVGGQEEDAKTFQHVSCGERVEEEIALLVQ